MRPIKKNEKSLNTFASNAEFIYMGRVLIPRAKEKRWSRKKNNFDKNRANRE
jgi:hypothetical protein